MNEKSRLERIFDPKDETVDLEILKKLGLRAFPKRSFEEKMKILGSKEKVSALDAIETTTKPLAKKEVKKGIVLEILENNFISSELLKNNPLVYIGSGADIEYPLALGARNIVMVDVYFGHSNFKDKLKVEVIDRIKKLIAKNPEIMENKLEFQFDFGQGKEKVTVELNGQMYPFSEESRMGKDYAIQDNMGAIVLFASGNSKT